MLEAARVALDGEGILAEALAIHIVHVEVVDGLILDGGFALVLCVTVCGPVRKTLIKP
jgi:hypothetical protein